ncbi:MAG: hypothetical protein J6X33_05345 [Clostridiales bacterium]|nr:hypothetical protein [Clostridiales bacterium]
MSIKDNIFAAMYRKYNSVDRRKISLAILIVYCVLIIAGLIFHEQTPDEAKAWIIARDASFHDMIFLIPKYEGHPPFWHLLLSVPAKLGADYEISMCIIQFIGAGLLCFVFEFLTPFNNLARTFVPFTYFFFYRWGIYQRPYALLAAGLVFASYAYGKRREKPWLFIISLAFMCLWSLYGIVIAGGIAVAWLIEMTYDSAKSGKGAFSWITGDRKRLLGLTVLLAFALITIYLMIPAKDNYMYSAVASPGILMFFAHAAKVIFFVPAECFITSFMGTDLLYSYNYSVSESLICIAVSAVFYYVLFTAAVRKIKLLYFAVPFLFFMIISSNYIYLHHFGIVLFLAVFYLAVCKEDKAGKDSDRMIVPKLVSIFSVAAFCMAGMFWSFASLMCDAMYDCASGAALASFIKDNNIENLTMDCAWHTQTDDAGSITVNKPDTGIYAFIISAPYFEGNHVRNAIDGTAYNLTVEYGEDKIEDHIDKTRKKDAPELLYALNDGLKANYVKLIGLKEEYIPVFYSIEAVPCKDKQSFFLGGVLYARSDIASRYGLKEVKLP